MENGHHSAQDRFFGIIPKAVLYGVLIGCAAGLILWKGFNLSGGAVIPIILAIVGLGAGMWADRRFYASEDGLGSRGPGAAVQDEDTVEDAIQDAEDAEEFESEENLSSPQGLRHMFQRNIADSDEDEDPDNDDPMDIEEPEGETDIPEKV